MPAPWPTSPPAARRRWAATCWSATTAATASTSTTSCRNRACPRCHARETAEWTAARIDELLPVRRLSPVFRAKFAAQVRRELPGFEMPGAVWRKRWVVFSRPCLEGGRAVLGYLARYVRRGPLGDHAILAADEDRIAFRYTDNHTRERRTVNLAPTEFLRRYLQHTLPPGFHRIRYYGLWAPANRN